MNKHRLYKDAIYQQFGRIGQAVSSPKRLELLDLLCQGPRTVEALAKEASLTFPNASRHLNQLRGAGLVESHKEGLYVTYRIADDLVCEFVLHMRRLAERRLAEIERLTHRYLEGGEGMEGINRQEVMERLRQGVATLIDVRPPEEYRAGHIAGAVSIPLKELESRLAELPPDQEIVAYCRGPYCVLAIQAVETLRSKGYRAFRLADGVQDWKAGGYEIAAGNESRP